MMGRSSDFKFWKEKLPIDHHSCGDSGGDEVEFEAQRYVEDQVGAYSPPLWTGAAVDFSQETSTLLPHNHHYRCPSPTSRLRAIMDGKREIMEMIKDMPESSYELSLKDIVDDQPNIEEVQDKEVVAEEKKVKHKTENRIPQKSKNTKSSQICRTESMESEVFLLKMFLPVSLSSKKKPKARKHSKICPGQSSEGSEKQANKDWWKMIFSAVKDKQYSAKINRRTSNISSNRTSLVENNLIPGQWSFSEKKCKSRGRKGCLF